MSVYVTNRLMKKDNAIVCRYASKYNLLILLLVCWRPKIESADRPLNTGSTSNQQDFPDKRLIKSFIPSVFVRASMVQMSPSCELTYYVTVLCSFDSVGIPLVLSWRAVCLSDMLHSSKKRMTASVSGFGWRDFGACNLDSKEEGARVLWLCLRGFLLRFRTGIWRCEWMLQMLRVAGLRPAPRRWRGWVLFLCFDAAGSFLRAQT